MAQILLKNTAESGSIPTHLAQGEIGINTTDGKIYYSDGAANNIKQFGISSSFASTAATSSYALTASYALNGGGGGSVDTSSLVTTSSFNSFTSSYNTGSFTGSFIGTHTGSLFGTSSWAISASWAPVQVSASYALTSSYSNNSTSASYALTASYLSGYVSPFPYTGSALITGSLGITGSLNITGSTTQTGNNTLIGNTVLSGSINVSGSSNFHNSIFIVTGSQFYSGSSDFKGNQTLTGSFNVTGSGTFSGYLIANGNLGINTSSPTIPLDVHASSSSGNIVQIDNTKDATDTRIMLLQSGSAAWFFGNEYDSGNNNFAIWDASGAPFIYKRLSITTGGGVTATSFTGSLFGTASRAVSASWAPVQVSASYATTASYAANGGVTQLIAGTNIVLSPSNGLGQVTITSTGGSSGAGANITSSFTNQSTWTFTHGLSNQGVIVQTYDTSWNQIIPQTIVLTDSNTATITFPTLQSGYAIASLGGSTNTAVSASYALTASYALNGGGTTVNTGSFVTTSSFNSFTSSYSTGSFTGSFNGIHTGSLFGTSSWAANATTAPLYLPLAGGSLTGNLFGAGKTVQFQDLVLGYGTSFGTIKTDGTKYIGMFPNSGVESTRFLANGSVMLGTTFTDAGYRLQVSASGAASGALQIIGTSTITGSLSVSAGITGSHFGTSSYATQALSASFATTSSYVNMLNQAVIVTGSLAVSGSTGTLFSSNVDTLILTGSLIVTGSTVLTGSLSIGVSTIVANTVTASISGSNILFNQATGSFTGAKYLYTVASASNARTGEMLAVWNGTTTQYTDNSTLDIGGTTAVTASVSISASQAQFIVQTTNAGWTLKSQVTYL